MNKRQLVTLWITGIAISLIAIVVVETWGHTKYPFYLFITASLPPLIIGALLYYTLGKVEHPLRWFHSLRRRRKIFIVILILLSAVFLTILNAWTLGEGAKKRKAEKESGGDKTPEEVLKEFGISGINDGGDKTPEEVLKEFGISGP